MRFWHCGSHRLEIGPETIVMAIVNATPDSFSGDGRLGEAVVKRGLQAVEDGARILDIGGESTRPGAPGVSLEEELARVLPVIEALASRTTVPISIDTTKSEVARRALEAGASIVNDISGATFDPRMLEVCARYECGLVLMHLRGTPRNMGWSQATNGAPQPANIVPEVLEFWGRRLEAAREAGIAEARLCFDAGFGFGKSVEENLELVRRGRELANFGFPTLSGTSRKSTIGKILGDAPVEERLFGTAAFTALAIANGADIIRVHDVKAMSEVARVTDALCR